MKRVVLEERVAFALAPRRGWIATPAASLHIYNPESIVNIMFTSCEKKYTSICSAEELFDNILLDWAHALMETTRRAEQAETGHAMSCSKHCSQVFPPPRLIFTKNKI